MLRPIIPVVRKEIGSTRAARPAWATQRVWSQSRQTKGGREEGGKKRGKEGEKEQMEGWTDGRSQRQLSSLYAVKSDDLSFISRTQEIQEENVSFTLMAYVYPLIHIYSSNI